MSEKKENRKLSSVYVDIVPIIREEGSETPTPPHGPIASVVVDLYPVLRRADSAEEAQVDPVLRERIERLLSLDTEAEAPEEAPEEVRAGTEELLLELQKARRAKGIHRSLSNKWLNLASERGKQLEEEQQEVEKWKKHAKLMEENYKEAEQRAARWEREAHHLDLKANSTRAQLSKERIAENLIESLSRTDAKPYRIRKVEEWSAEHEYTENCD